MFAFLLAAPQIISLIQFAVNYYQQSFSLITPLPNMLLFLCLGIHVVLSGVHTTLFSLQALKKSAFMDWYSYGSN